MYRLPVAVPSYAWHFGRARSRRIRDHLDPGLSPLLARPLLFLGVLANRRNSENERSTRVTGYMRDTCEFEYRVANVSQAFVHGR